METVWRVAAVYLFLMIALRVMGKRDLGQLAPFDLVVLLLIPEIFSQSLVGGDVSLTTAVVGAATLLSLVFVTSVATYLSKGLSIAVEGSPSILVCRGEFVTENLNRERVPPEEILSQMHQAGIGDLHEVDWGILEPNGAITFIPSQGQAPGSAL